ncbi:transcription-repair coupling factor [Frateuria sp. GZRR33]|uniref:transcription-repair coupling factor n=1 Tax=Frateuria sp. GZRR33 TaxID=3351535 RepID=UPI003EDB7332
MPRSIPAPTLPRSARSPCAWALPHGSALALWTVLAAQAHEGVVVLVADDPQRAWVLEDELAFFAGALPVLHFPDWETLPYDEFNPHPRIVSQRIATLQRLATLERGVLVVPVTALMQRIAPPAYLATGLRLASGDTLTPADARRALEANGYRRVAQVADPGDYAPRGSVLDVYPTGAAQPFRVRFAEGAVASIKAVDADTQRSQQAIERLDLLPAREFPLDADAVRRFRAQLRERIAGDPEACPLYRDMREGLAPAGVESWLPLFFEHTATLFDYLPGSPLFVPLPDTQAAARMLWDEACARHARRADGQARPLLPPDALYLEPTQLEARLAKQRRVRFDTGAGDNPTTPAPPLTLARASGDARTLADFLDGHAGAVLIAADSPGRRDALVEALDAIGRAPRNVAGWRAFLDLPARQALAVTVAPLEQGFVLAQPPLAVLTERELYGLRARRPRRRRHEGGPLAPRGELAELREDEPVVHVDSGVGRYRGLQAMELGGSPGEFLAIEYAKGDKLYVPVTQLGQVSRYAGTSPERAPLHALGSGAWERARAKAAGDVRDAAAELLALQAAREARSRPPLKIDRRQLAAFAADFPYEETPDQRAAIDAVMADLAAPRPMDRVICGDVGFGKTEVALRAAFAVASAGKQVAVLVPTTLLAQQHCRSFVERLEGWPVTVEAISRFRAGRKLDATLERLADGRLDILIGTHKLLQPQVRFHDLGLVIIDEEQRFGVRQKERLKQLRSEVDVLTMTATPIPRTLGMALGGLRHLSLIATAPTERIAVRTTVTPWDRALIADALRRELARGGQAYFLHNAVESIQRIADELRSLVPEARLAVAHGQMKAGELEQVMGAFLRRRYNVLVCTTIIETGIDIPGANTIVIDRAENFGLAQLQQLRGRVGRSARRAYAYLVVSDPDTMTEEARLRLDAFAAEEELGAGFALAARDLEIRGAGELLGEEQSGQIQAVGFSVYARLLERTVQALKDGEEPDVDLTRGDTVVELHLPVLIPDDYVPDVPTRLALYKRIAGADAEEALHALEMELVDRFGLLPEPTARLFALARLRLMAQPLGIARVDMDHHGGVVVFGRGTTVDAAALDRLIEAQPEVYAREDEDRLAVTLDLAEPADAMRAAEELLVRLGARRPEADLS